MEIPFSVIICSCLFCARKQCLVERIHYVYMSSDGPQKRDSRFWRHCTVRFTSV